MPNLGQLAGPFGSLGAPMGLPHGSQNLLKAPIEHHRGEMKVVDGVSNEERLVSSLFINSY